MDSFTFDIKRFAADTCQLCTLGRGAYVALLLHYYATELPLPDDDEALARIAGVTAAEWDGIKVKIRKFFKVQPDGMLHQKRCDRTLAMKDLDAEPQGDKTNGTKKRSKGSRIPADWRPTDALKAYARQHGCDPDRTADRFLNHFLASSLKTAWKSNWDAAFRNWCLEDEHRRHTGVNGAHAGAPVNGHGGGFTATLLRFSSDPDPKLDDRRG